MGKKSKFKDEITLKHLSDDFVGLNRNGADLFCPFVPPIVFQQKNIQIVDAQPQITQSRSTCTSLCPLFKIMDGGKMVRLNCGNSVEYSIDKIIPIEETIKRKTEGIIKKMDKNIN